MLLADMKVPQRITDNLRDWLDEWKAKEPEAEARLRTVRATYSSKRPVASRSRSYRLVSGNGGNQDSRRTIQLS